MRYLIAAVFALAGCQPRIVKCECSPVTCPAPSQFQFVPNYVPGVIISTQTLPYIYGPQGNLILTNVKSPAPVESVKPKGESK